MRLTQIIESLLFASDAPLSAADLSRVDERLDEDTVEAVIQELRAEYELSERSFQIYEVGGGFQLLTRPEFVTVLERYDSVPQPSRLSAPALEVLAIIAYRQPLGRAEIEDIRGVGSSGVLRTLQERSLVEPVARGEGLGRPLLYGTTSKFLEHFGFRSLEDLPRPDELPVVLRDRTPVNTLPLDDDDADDAAGEGMADASAGAPLDAESPGDVSADAAGTDPGEEAASTGDGAASADAPTAALSPEEPGAPEAAEAAYVADPDDGDDVDGVEDVDDVADLDDADDVDGVEGVDDVAGPDDGDDVDGVDDVEDFGGVDDVDDVEGFDGFDDVGDVGDAEAPTASGEELDEVSPHR